MLKPFDLNPTQLPGDVNTVDSLPPDLINVLADNGLAQKESPRDVNLKQARDIFNKSGATLEKAAEQVSNLMTNADTAGARLKAVELTMKVHGILQEMDDKPIPNIIVNVIGSDHKTLINLVLPTT